MLTGDSQTTASAVAKKLDIDDVIAEVLPDQKVDAVKRLPARRLLVAMAEMASTTLRRSPGGASPWARVPTSPWKALRVTP